jgi:hypothetical protein
MSNNKQTNNKLPQCLWWDGAKGATNDAGCCNYSFIRTLAKTITRSRNRETIADLRLATCYLRALAVLKMKPIQRH